MDAGLAALLGAAVGSLTTLGAAVVNGRTQARTQHVQWRRQHRRDAYAAYLSALHDRDIAMDAILDAAQADPPDLPGLDEKVQHFIACARDVHRAAEVVILEGPPSVVEATDRIAEESSGLSEVMQRMVKAAHAADGTEREQHSATASARERRLYQAVSEFRVQARSVLGNAD
ncbi:proline dehydrogenase [Actinomadura violacea]|uniref:Proline dehydrogenase n=1 Tax=Actinomadura violacea TaxID=2819934 RepID=A0ABS3RV12_9ACTN|nr:proline dehydrogenase [Actinomadura violacea]MBO2460594.1 proline dehydrogenase [Actinomadura violacea]